MMRKSFILNGWLLVGLVTEVMGSYVEDVFEVHFLHFFILHFFSHKAHQFLAAATSFA